MSSEEIGLSLQLMPLRADIAEVDAGEWKAQGNQRPRDHQNAIDLLQRSDDVVFGDREGVSFIPPHLVQGIIDEAQVTHIHDEWTKKKFDEGKSRGARRDFVRGSYVMVAQCCEVGGRGMPLHAGPKRRGANEGRSRCVKLIYRYGLH